MINYKNFKKSISLNIDNKKKSETLDKDNNINYITKSNTIHIIGSNLINGDNQNNIINISYHSRFYLIFILNDDNNKRPTLFLNRIKIGKNDNTNKDVIKRLNSQQHFTNSKLIKFEMPKRNNILKFNDQFQRCTGDNYTDIKSSYSHKKNPNTPIIDNKIISKFTHRSETKKESSKNCNYIQKITISKINPQENNNVSSLIKNNNNGNLSNTESKTKK